MKADPVTTVTGNAATEPESRVTGTGRKVTNFRIASSERRKDQTGEWVDGNRFYVSVACWNGLADNVERSVRKGTPLIVTGRISQRMYTDAQDKVQFAYEIQAETVGPDLNRGFADFTKVNRMAGQTISTDAYGMPLTGVAEDEFETEGRRLRPDELTVHGDGAAFGTADGDLLTADPFDEPERDAADLVGAGG